MTATPQTRWIVHCNKAGCTARHIGDLAQSRAAVRKQLRAQGWTTGVDDGSGSLSLRDDYCPDHKPAEEAPDAQPVARPPADRADVEAPRVPARPPASAWLTRQRRTGSDPHPARLPSPAAFVGAAVPAGRVGADGPAGHGGDGAAQAGRRPVRLLEPPRGRHAARKNVPRSGGSQLPAESASSRNTGPGHMTPDQAADYLERLRFEQELELAKATDVPRSRAQAAGKPGSDVRAAHGPGHQPPAEGVMQNITPEFTRPDTDLPDLTMCQAHPDDCPLGPEPHKFIGPDENGGRGPCCCRQPWEPPFQPAKAHVGAEPENCGPAPTLDDSPWWLRAAGWPVHATGVALAWLIGLPAALQGYVVLAWRWLRRLSHEVAWRNAGGREVHRAQPGDTVTFPPMRDEDWCPGCGFANLSSGPCETCGYDPRHPGSDPPARDEPAALPPAEHDDRVHYTPDPFAAEPRPECGAPHPDITTSHLEHVTCRACRFSLLGAPDRSACTDPPEESCSDAGCPVHGWDGPDDDGDEAPTRGDDQGWVSGHCGLDDPAGDRSPESGSLSPRHTGETPARATARRASPFGDAPRPAGTDPSLSPAWQQRRPAFSSRRFRASSIWTAPGSAA